MRAIHRPASWSVGLLAGMLAAASIAPLGCTQTTKSGSALRPDDFSPPEGPPPQNLTVGPERILIGLYSCTQIHSRFLPLQVEPPLSEDEGSEPTIDGQYTRFWLLVALGLEDPFVRRYTQHVRQLPREERLVEVGDGYNIGPVVHVCFRGLVSREGSYQKGYYKRMVRPLELLEFRPANREEIQLLRDRLRRPTQRDIRDLHYSRPRSKILAGSAEVDLTKHLLDRILTHMPLFALENNSSE